MPYFPGGGGTANLSGTATQLDVSGSALTATVDGNNTMILIGNGGAPVQMTGVFSGFAQVLNFAGNGTTSVAVSAGTGTVTLSGVAGPAGPTGTVSAMSGAAWGAVQYSTGSGPALSGALSASIGVSGNLQILAQSGSVPAPVPVGARPGATLFVRNRIGWNVLGVNPTSGTDYQIQPHVGRNKIAWWNPPGNATTAPGVLGFAAIVSSGTATANNVVATPFSATLKRIGYAGAATANNGAAVCGAARQWFRGSEAGSSGGGVPGGFHMIIRGCIDLNTVTVAQAAFFCGMSASIVDTGAGVGGAPFITGVFINGVGVCKPSGATNYAFIWNGAGGIASSSDTGIPMAAGNAFEVAVYSPPNGSYCGVSLEILQSGTQIAHTIISNSNLPVNTTMLNPHVWLVNGGTAAAVRLAVEQIYVFSDT